MTLRHLRIRLAYEGTNYAGWQIQPDQPTVQAAVESAILRLTGEAVSVLAASRTDAGVHALGQIASFVTQSSIPVEKWRLALQAELPDDIVVRNCEVAATGFHATYAARSKRYRYVILNSRVNDPFLRRFTWRVGTELKVEVMDSAARCLEGTHDFRSFESHWPNTAHSIRTINEARVFRSGAWNLFSSEGARSGVVETERPFVVFEIVGNGFLYNMVRAIVGTLVQVGRGFRTPDEFHDILRTQNRAVAGETAPAQGLYLVSVDYVAADLAPPENT